MRKQKIYLDVSTISNLVASHTPELESATRLLFEFVKNNPEKYEFVISPMVEFELGNTPEPRRKELFDSLSQYDLTTLEDSEDALELRDIYIKQGVLSEKHIRDLTHIAYAVSSGCDVIASWNFKHLANQRTIHRVNGVNQIFGYRSIEILTPPNITGENLYDIS